MATAFYPVYQFPTTAKVILSADGSAVVQSGTHEMGMGTATVQAQHAADCLGLPVDRVRFEYGDTALPFAAVTGGSATRISVGAAVIAACGALKKTLLGLAAPGSPIRGAEVARVIFKDSGLARAAAEVVAEASDALAAGRTRFAGFDGVECLLEVVPPPPTLIVAGAGPDALPLVRLAKELGWLVAVVDPRDRPATRDRFPLADQLLIAPRPADLFALAARPRAAAVVRTHNGADDLAMLRALLPSPVDYLGLLGPRRKADDLAEALVGEFGQADLDRVRSPAGLDLGAETPAEIALAILAEIQAVLAGHPAGPLRDRDRPIHDRPDPGLALVGPVDSSREACSLGTS